MTKRSSVANKSRTPSAKGKKALNSINIIDENPADVAYNNPPGFQYVRAEVTDPEGDTAEHVLCLSLDQLKRIKASSSKK